MMLMMKIGKLFMPMTKIKPLVLQPNWQIPSNVHALITTSSNEFNLALHVNDNAERVLANRARVLDYVPTAPLWLNQTHSTTVVNWDQQDYTVIDADAAITRKHQKVCVVMTADCLPILLTNKNGSFVAAIHAGWRGLNNGIIQNTIKQLTVAEKEDIIAFIGPAINQECFEVGAEVREEFLNNNSYDKQFFISSTNTAKFMCNLRGIAEQRLLELGVQSKNIFNSQICTKCHPEWFFSYRQNSNTGRFATLIWLD